MYVVKPQTSALLASFYYCYYCMRPSPLSDRNSPNLAKPWSELGPLEPSMSDGRDGWLMIALINGIRCLAELRSPDRYRVLPPDHNIELAFRDVTARVSAGRMIAVVVKGVASLCPQTGFTTSTC